MSGRSQEKWEAAILLRQDHRIDDVDDAVISLNVSSRDRGIIYFHAISRVDIEATALHGGSTEFLTRQIT